MNPLSLSSPLALVPILAVAATPLVTAGFIYAFYFNYDSTTRPILDFFTKRGGGWVGGLIRWVTRPLVRRIEDFVREHVSAMRRQFYANETMLVVALDSLSDVATRLAGTLGDQAEQIYTALWTLNHETIPRKIEAALTPVRNRLDRHTDRLDALEDLNRRVAVTFGDVLRELPWGVPGGYVTNFETFGARFVQLWRHYWDTTRVQLNRLFDETIPELRRDIADLANRLDVQIDARFDALAARLSDLERWRENVVMPRLQALTEAVDVLAAEIFGEIDRGFAALLERIGQLEAQLEQVIPAEIASLRDALAQLRLELEQGIATGLEAFRERIGSLELEVFTEIPQRLAAMQLALDTLAAEVFTEVGAGLGVLTERIVALEQYVFGELRPLLDLTIGRIEAVETQIRDDVLPRLRSIEGLLEPAAFAVAVGVAMRAIAPNLFCRNVTTATQRLCGLDENLIAQLLAGTMVFALALDPRVIARLGQEMTGAMGGLWRETVMR